jgi:hypothetical protein
MSETYRKESRKDWQRSDSEVVYADDLKIGCLQRIADACELMALRHDELVRAKDAAQRDAAYYEGLFHAADRRVSAAKGQITKLKKLLAAKEPA